MPNLSELQFGYETPETGGRTTLHRVVAHNGEEEIGNMDWNVHGIQAVNVAHGYRRRGIATSMWNEGHRVSDSDLTPQGYRRVPAPAHSGDRTDAGDAWARAVGGKLPHRKNV